DVTELQRLRDEARARDAAPTEAQLHERVLARAAAVQRANERLAARVNFITDLFAQAPGFMAVLRGPDHVFELANAAYERLVGRSDFIGQPVASVLPDVAGQGFFELLDQVRASGQPYIGRGEVVVLDAGGGPRMHYVDFIYQPIRDAAGQVEGIFVQGADVTDREEALRALRDSEARFRTITNLLPQMIWSTRPDGHSDFFNQRWYDYTGVAVGASDGDAWTALVHPDDRERAAARWRQSTATGEPYEVEYRLRGRDGDYRWVLGRGLPVRDEAGAILRWMGTCTDIHEHKLTLDALRRSREALEAVDRQKDQFLAMLAHELRNPLAPISTAAHLLAMAPERVETVRQAAEIIDRQASHMRNLVEDLVDVSRVTRGLVAMQPAVMALHEVLAAAVEQTAPLVERRGHRLEVRDRAPGLRLWADPTRLTQVLANLLNNAAKYTPSGGRIVVDVERDGGAGVVVRVSDNGIGMDPPLLGRLFDLFAQAESTPERHEGGLGIGLALARSLVQLHGGTLEASSPGLGQGSTFELRLPAAAIVSDAPVPTAA
ncbi:MAG: PAS domain-containing protein, partial [Lysobacter sp.]|nr:PAS domain-containing protein [Lysobacter sp.]